MARKLICLLLSTSLLLPSVIAAPPLEPRGHNHSKTDRAWETSCSAAREEEDWVRYTVWIARPLQQGHCRTARGTMGAAGWQSFIKECIPRKEDKSLDVVFRARKHTTGSRDINKALQNVWQGSDFKCPSPPPRPTVPKLVLPPKEHGGGGGEPKPVINDDLLSPGWQAKPKDDEGSPKGQAPKDDSPLAQGSKATLPPPSTQPGAGGHDSEQSSTQVSRSLAEEERVDTNDGSECSHVPCSPTLGHRAAR